MKEIKLTQGYIALVDDEDHEHLSSFNWFAYRRGHVVYARRNIPGDHNHKIAMHREILNAQPGQIVDHRDRNGLNNQRSNLRFATHAENVRNKCSHKNNVTGFKGVSVYDTTRFRACIWNGKGRHLGIFDVAEDAAKAYDQAARELFGEFARVNFPES